MHKLQGHWLGGGVGTIEGRPGPRRVEGFVCGCNQLSVQPALAELRAAPRAGGFVRCNFQASAGRAGAGHVY